MNPNLVLFALMGVYLTIVLADDQRQKAILDIIEQGYQDSVSSLTQEQIIDLNYFKHIVSKSKHVHVDDPLKKIPDQVFAKRIAQFLQLKCGPYPEKLVREEHQDKFVNDYIRYLAEPCEKLRVSFRLSMALYYSKIDERDFVQLVKQNIRSYELLETAGVCETLLKFTDSICLKSYRYLVDKKTTSKPKRLLERFKHSIRKGKPSAK